MPNRIKPIVGIKNSHPLRPYVELEIEEDWLSPAQARRFGARLIVAAYKAELLFAKEKPTPMTGEDP